jgi:PPOX class probable F420-dependent enzyme
MVKLTPEQRRYFEDSNLCAVSTLSKDGYPHVTMAWVDIDDDDHVLLNSTETRSWPKNLRRDPRIGLCVFARENEVSNVAAVGRVVEMTNEGGWDHIQKLARKYGLAEYRGPQNRVLIRVEIEKIHNYGV